MKIIITIISTIILLSVLTTIQVFAQPSAEITTHAQEVSESVSPTSTQVIININVHQVLNQIPCDVKFDLYSSDKSFIGTKKLSLDFGHSFDTLVFDVPEYLAGTTFYLSCFSGAESIYFNNTYYPAKSMIPLLTGAYTPTSPEDTGVGNTFVANLTPLSHKPVIFTVYNNPIYLTKPATLIGDACFVPLYDFFNTFGLDTSLIYYSDADKKIDIYGPIHHLTTYIDTTSILINDTRCENVNYTKSINGEIYIPLQLIADCMGIRVTEFDYYGIHYIDLKSHIYFDTEAELLINQRNISSRTDHLIWVSKKDFTVSVFQGSQNNWNLIQQFPCTIGKPSTPTITGQFEYYSKETRWSYAKYYVAPIMRFKGGYALHSTLIKYDGTDYDARVGEKLSLGCVRLRPADINWLAESIPLYTKVYITE